MKYENMNINKSNTNGAEEGIQLLNLLENFGNTTSFNWMSSEQFKDFSNQFTIQHIATFGKLSWYFSGEVYNDTDINNILYDCKIPYEIHTTCYRGEGRQYKIIKNSII